MRPAEAERLVHAYGAVLGESAATGVVRDVSSLPGSKSQIKTALLFALKVTDDKFMREHLKSAYVSLADFQSLSDEQVKVLQKWNKIVAQTSSADAASAATLSSLGKHISLMHDAVSHESKALLEELKELGF